VSVCKPNRVALALREPPHALPPLNSCAARAITSWLLWRTDFFLLPPIPSNERREEGMKHAQSA
jgi:hypothetical protein